MGFMPENISESKIYGIEIDSIIGRIAQQLYQKNRIAIQGFEDSTLPDSFLTLLSVMFRLVILKFWKRNMINIIS